MKAAARPSPPAAAASLPASPCRGGQQRRGREWRPLTRAALEQVLLSIDAISAETDEQRATRKAPEPTAPTPPCTPAANNPRRRRPARRQAPYPSPAAGADASRPLRAASLPRARVLPACPACRRGAQGGRAPRRGGQALVARASAALDGLDALGARLGGAAP